VFADASCSITEASSIQADPILQGESAELGAGSPAIDFIPLGLCKATDGLGRPRNDGNSDGVIDCDAGALEYSGFEVTVRANPWWLPVGMLDVATDTALIVTVFSSENFDATTIDFSTIDVVGLESSALRGPAFADRGGDGLTDYIFRYKLSRMAPLDCGSYDQPFSAKTTAGTEVTGQLRFDVTGCGP
jgi:hypothetical protein